MTTTTHLALPYLTAAQAQKHVTVNEALRILDAVTQLCVIDRNRTTPPLEPAEGARHIVGAAASGAWQGHGDAIACWQDGAWRFAAPQTGWCAWSIADAAMLIYAGGWSPLQADAPDTVDMVGINTSANSYNRLSLRSNAALLTSVNTDDSGNGNIQVQISKQAAGHTASLYFSNNYSGRAEFGLIGSDAFSLKVSPNGSSWVEALTFDAAQGGVSFPGAVALSGVLAPPMLVADQNNYHPAGLGRASVVKLASDAARTITGIEGGYEGRVLLIINAGGNPITFSNDSAASTATNRMAFSANLRLAGKQSLTLRYDSSAQRWFCIAASPGVSLV